MWDWVYLIPIVGMVMTIGVPIAVIISHYLLRMKQAEIIRIAIEKGEEIPPELLAIIQGTSRKPKEMKPREYNIRHGIILAAVGVGLFVPLYFVGGFGATAWCLLPLVIGGAFLSYAYLIPSPRQQEIETKVPY